MWDIRPCCCSFAGFAHCEMKISGPFQPPRVSIFSPTRITHQCVIMSNFLIGPDGVITTTCRLGRLL